MFDGRPGVPMKKYIVPAESDSFQSINPLGSMLRHYTCDRLNVFVRCTSVSRVVLDVAVLGDIPWHMFGSYRRVPQVGAVQHAKG